MLVDWLRGTVGDKLWKDLFARRTLIYVKVTQLNARAALLNRTEWYLGQLKQD